MSQPARPWYTIEAMIAVSHTCNVQHSGTVGSYSLPYSYYWCHHALMSHWWLLEQVYDTAGDAISGQCRALPSAELHTFCILATLFVAEMRNLQFCVSGTSSVTV